MDLRYLFLDLNSYFASVEQQRKPDLRGEPVIVVPVMTDYTCAIAASYEAKKFGIKTGTGVKEAKQMCPRLQIVLADHKAYVDYHHRIKAAMDECVPVTITASIDEFGAQLMKNESSVRDSMEIAYAIKDVMRRKVGQHIRASIGIAPTRWLAKIACDMQKPDGLTVIEGHEIQQKLCRLQLNDLPGVGHNMEGRLRAAGVHTMRDLYAREAKHLRRIWNSVAGEQMYYRLRGVEIPDLPTTRSTVGHSHVLAPKWRPVGMAFVVAQRMILKAASRLRRIEHLTGAMELSIRFENGDRRTWATGFDPVCDNHHLMATLHQLWDAMLRDRPAGHLKKISIGLHRLTPIVDRQPTLFDAREAGNPHSAKRLAELSLTMDRINARFGRDTLVQGFVPNEIREFSGPKIAFSRVPEYEEFHE